MASEPSGQTDCSRNAAGNAVLALNCIMFALATVLVPLRLYTRVYVVKSPGWDDLTIGLSYLVYIPTVAFLLKACACGLGRHMTCISLSSALAVGEAEYIAEDLEIFCVILARASAALFVLRIFGVLPWLRIFLKVWTTFMVVALGTTGIIELLQCVPAEGLWNPGINARCWSTEGRAAFDNFNGAVSICSDFVLALLPLYFLSTLQLSFQQKCALGSLFALGLLPETCAIVRTVLSSTQGLSDPIRDTAILDVFGSLETGLLVICTTVPALPALRTKRSASRSSSKRNDSWTERLYHSFTRSKATTRSDSSSTSQHQVFVEPHIVKMESTVTTGRPNNEIDQVFDPLENGPIRKQVDVFIE